SRVVDSLRAARSSRLLIGSPPSRELCPHVRQQVNPNGPGGGLDVQAWVSWLRCSKPNQSRERSDPRRERGSGSFGRPFRLSANRLRECILLPLAVLVDHGLTLMAPPEA